MRGLGSKDWIESGPRIRLAYQERFQSLREPTGLIACSVLGLLPAASPPGSPTQLRRLVSELYTHIVTRLAIERACC